MWSGEGTWSFQGCLQHLIISSRMSATHMQSEKTQECKHPVEKVT